MEVISCFSVREINHSADYERFRNTLAYINNQYEDFIRNRPFEDVHRELMSVSGYAKYFKFLDHLKKWNRLMMKVPNRYLEHIGCKQNVIEFTYELDRQEYEKALEVARYPRIGILRIFAAMYSPLYFPDGSSEEEAIQFLVEKQRKMAAEHQGNQFSMAINYPGIKMIFVEAHGKIETKYYRPALRFSRFYLFVDTEDGSHQGTCRIK